MSGKIKESNGSNWSIISIISSTYYTNAAREVKRTARSIWQIKTTWSLCQKCFSTMGCKRDSILWPVTQYIIWQGQHSWNWQRYILLWCFSICGAIEKFCNVQKTSASQYQSEHNLLWLYSNIVCVELTDYHWRKLREDTDSMNVWCFALLAHFKKANNVALSKLMSKKYTVWDAQNWRESAKYV